MSASYYHLNPQIHAFADPQLHNDTVRNLWKHFCLTAGELTLSAGAPQTFRIGSASLPSLLPDSEFALCVNAQGVGIVGRDCNGLMRGFCVLLMQLEPDGVSCSFRIRHQELQGRYSLTRRMLHLCVFPETDLYFLKKAIRLAGVAQYTHVVLEFWGTLQYDCMKELAWPNAFTKEQIRPVIREIRELGMEPIPMFNQLGHATASRLMYGKHVVLDQNPRLQHLFTPDGWSWNIQSEQVFELLTQVRAELCALFGPGEYFHIGCDEAYSYTHDDTLRPLLPAYFRRLTETVCAEGRRPMLWMDMMLPGIFGKGYTAFSNPEEADALLNALADGSVAVDWQYDTDDMPLRSAVYLQEHGADVMVAPWYNPKNYAALVDTAITRQMSGVMMTTWHTLRTYMPSILGCAKKTGAFTFYWSESSNVRLETTALLRRVSFERNARYEDAGWSKLQIDV